MDASAIVALTGVVVSMVLSIIALKRSKEANSHAHREAKAAENAVSEARRANIHSERSAEAAESAVVEARQANNHADRSAKAAEESVDESRKQTAIQDVQSRRGAEPYVWADIRPDSVSAERLILIVGNSGPSVATNVVVKFDPPLHELASVADHAVDGERRLNAGVSSLAPGRTMAWYIGVFPQVLIDNPQLSFAVTITGDGPFGPLELLRYQINVDDFRTNLTPASAPGTLLGVTEAVKGLGRKLDRVTEALEATKPQRRRRRWSGAGSEDA